MAAPTRSIDYRLKYTPRFDRPVRIQLGRMNIKKTVILMIVFWVLIFFSAFYYVEQQVRLQTLNYKIIALKEQKKALLEHHKTLQLQLHELKRLDRIEHEMRKEGFVPVEEDHIHIIR